VTAYGSCIFLAIAVTKLRGETRTDCATSQFLNPEITTGFPAINARYPSSATVRESIEPILSNRWPVALARLWNSVAVAPGTGRLR